MANDEITCDFDEFERCCKLLARRIELRERDAVAVLKATRPGAIYMAALMESLKGIDVYTLNYEIRAYGKKIQANLVGQLRAGLRKRRVFLLTDIANSGKILKRARKDLKDAGNEVIICVIHYRKGSKVKPHIHIKEVDRNVRYSDWEKARE